jgi:cytochrome P450
MVIEEALRMYPPVWVVERHAIKRDTVAGYEIPAGAGVVTSPYLTHRHPGIWDDPLAFQPERFTAEAAAARPAFAYFPFGGGPRQCIGNTFALVETQLILSAIAQRFRLDAAPGTRVVPEARITMRPRGLRMIARPRQRAAVHA